jgi:hypothetical protein
VKEPEKHSRGIYKKHSGNTFLEFEAIFYRSQLKVSQQKYLFNLLSVNLRTL